MAGEFFKAINDQIDAHRKQKAELAQALAILTAQNQQNPEVQAKQYAMQTIQQQNPEPTMRVSSTNPPSPEMRSRMDTEFQGMQKNRSSRILEAMSAHGLLPKAPLTLEDLEARAQATATGRQNVAGTRQDFTDTAQMRKEFIDRPEVKEFQTVGTNVNTMDAMLSSAVSGSQENKVALDQALVTLYNKLTDPQSVVRESEYARTGQNLPLVNRIQGAIQKVQKGGAGLTDADREALVLGAKIIANERGNTFNRTRQEYVDMATQAGFDPEMATRKMPAFQPFQVGAQGQAASQITPQQKAAYNAARSQGKSAAEARQLAGF